MRGRILQLAREGIRREYPHKPQEVFESDADWVPARERHPLFYGCFDWHSAVHGHWTLARLGEPPDFPADAVEQEARYLERHPAFEVPYGIAWLLQLCALVELPPLREVAVRNFARWLDRLALPLRCGQHSNSAFAMGLAWDAEPSLREPIAAKARAFYAEDRAAPIGYEPSAYDFLSPALCEADLMRRVLPDPRAWMMEFLPTMPLEPVTPTDRADGKLAHFDGLNLSRAWMLRNLGYVDLAEAHAEEGLKGLASDRYEVTHWLGTFACWWLTGA